MSKLCLQPIPCWINDSSCLECLKGLHWGPLFWQESWSLYIVDEDTLNCLRCASWFYTGCPKAMWIFGAKPFIIHVLSHDFTSLCTLTLTAVLHVIVTCCLQIWRCKMQSFADLHLSGTYFVMTVTCATIGFLIFVRPVALRTDIA